MDNAGFGLTCHQNSRFVTHKYPRCMEMRIYRFAAVTLLPSPFMFDDNKRPFDFYIFIHHINYISQMSV
jgi:hypothetical protein